MANRPRSTATAIGRIQSITMTSTTLTTVNSTVPATSTWMMRRPATGSLVTSRSCQEVQRRLQAARQGVVRELGLGPGPGGGPEALAQAVVVEQPGQRDR